ncbi:HEAT repeat domain-containing protein [Streptomyces sp. NBC_01077]|uniref:HEAT repeat domain-containing protein n=1 Tax=Streptomyces sp. NBC_01077 TaxID=2903746 RepID=UPI00386A6A91|nr:HEAT repeat domain-containing protein [Streptomyces sp. NBC_01077]WSV43683.1 HEAT repeat domain-containing protein [Streptomyces sp. NBC_01077]
MSPEEHHVQPAEADSDQAIARWLAHETTDSMRRLAELGPKALRRAIHIYYEGAASETITLALRSREDRPIVDAWATLLAELATTFPAVYLEEFEAGRVRLGSSPTLEVMILDSIHLPQVTALLAPFVKHSDQQTRARAVGGLGRRSDLASLQALATAVTDEEESIRREAARWLERRDPRRAHSLYLSLLEDPAVPLKVRAELVKRTPIAKRLSARRNRGCRPR